MHANRINEPHTLPPSGPHLVCKRRKSRPKSLTCWYHTNLIICAKVHPVRTIAGLSHWMPGHSAGICTGPISGSTIHNAGSTPSRSGGGARTAMRSRMICGKKRTGHIPYQCPPDQPVRIQILKSYDSVPQGWEGSLKSLYIVIKLMEISLGYKGAGMPYTLIYVAKGWRNF